MLLCLLAMVCFNSVVVDVVWFLCCILLCGMLRVCLCFVIVGLMVLLCLLVVIDFIVFGFVVVFLSMSFVWVTVDFVFLV